MSARDVLNLNKLQSIKRRLDGWTGQGLEHEDWHNSLSVLEWQKIKYRAEGATEFGLSTIRRHAEAMGGRG